MAKHISGNWYVESKMIVTDDYEIFYPAGCCLGMNEEQMDANLRLAAAAPELLEALRDLEVAANSLQYCFDHRPENFGVALTQLKADAQRARDTITKATQP